MHAFAPKCAFFKRKAAFNQYNSSYILLRKKLFDQYKIYKKALFFQPDLNLTLQGRTVTYSIVRQ